MNLILKKYQKAIVDLCKTLRIKRMYVFGSMANGSSNPKSDVDLLISFEDGISLEEYTENYFHLHYKLRALLDKEIDIITERSLTNPYFIKRIDKEKQLIYEG